MQILWDSVSDIEFQISRVSMDYPINGIMINNLLGGKKSKVGAISQILYQGFKCKKTKRYKK